MRALFLLVLTAGCVTDETVPGGDDTDDTGVAVQPMPFPGAPLAAISGTCPDVSGSGVSSVDSGADTYDVMVKIPASGGEGKPVLFFWHGLGGSAQLFDLWLDFQTFADDHDMIVVVPDSLDPNLNTWTLEEGRDMVLFDDLRSCLAQDLDIDLNRVYATGFSFGGLFTTALTMDRADSLAATLPMSGGTSNLWFPYRSPAQGLPVLVMWGGSSDTFGSGFSEVRFEEMSLDFSANLQDDGHLVHHCDHGLGHDVPSEWDDIVGSWFGSHTYGSEGPVDDADYPSWCSAP
jgi:poly(3-hydroxybutyrate) depolymerase